MHPSHIIISIHLVESQIGTDFRVCGIDYYLIPHQTIVFKVFCDLLSINMQLTVQFLWQQSWEIRAIQIKVLMHLLQLISVTQRGKEQ